MPTLDRQTLEQARLDVGVFAELLLGQPLWSHQLEVARSTARNRAMLCGRQSGKSNTLGVCALHEAFRAPGRLVLIVSAGESAARRLLAEIARLAEAPLLAGSKVDESKSEITLTNGSRIISVPASERQVRGWAADLLIVDEACFVDEAVLTAARFTLTATGGRLLMASTPFGSRDRFFARMWDAGMGGEVGYASWQWPSTVSPLVSDAQLAEWRPTMGERDWAMEIMAEWVGDQGAYFSHQELEAAVAFDWSEVDPMVAQGLVVNAGVDWGFANDANAVVLSGPIPEPHPLAGGGRVAVWLVRERFRMPYESFIEELVQLGSYRSGLRLATVAAETNGVGAMPTETLRRRMVEARACREVMGVTTSAKSKADQFGTAKQLAQAGRLVLPRHPELLKQLAGLEYEHRDSGVVSIAVPDRKGHDDLAMAFALSLAPVVVEAGEWRPKQVVTVSSYRAGLSRDRQWVADPFSAEQRERILASADPDTLESIRVREAAEERAMLEGPGWRR